jgi:hypothetical protein
MVLIFNYFIRAMGRFGRRAGRVGRAPIPLT